MASTLARNPLRESTTPLGAPEEPEVKSKSAARDEIEVPSLATSAGASLSRRPISIAAPPRPMTFHRQLLPAGDAFLPDIVLRRELRPAPPSSRPRRCWRGDRR